MVRVEWIQTAVDELTEVWLKADSSMRRTISLSARRIDDMLSVDPEAQGESRNGGRRIIFVEPLAAVFEVDMADDLVTIMSVWRFGRRRRSGP